MLIKYVSKYRYTFIGLSVLLVWWNFFSTPNTKPYTNLYTQNDYHQDTSRIYFDLGNAAAKRNDFRQAMIYYQTALSFKKDNIIHKALMRCMKKLKIKK